MFCQVTSYSFQLTDEHLNLTVGIKEQSYLVMAPTLLLLFFYFILFFETGI